MRDIFEPLKENLRHIKYYGFNSLSIRNFFIILAMLLMPFLSINYLVYRNNQELFNKEISSANEVALSNVQRSIDSIFSEIKRVSLQILADNETNILCRMDPSSRMSYQKKKLIDSIQETFGFVLVTYDYIESIHLYSEYNNYVVSTNAGGRLEDTKQLEWVKDYNSEELDNSWRILEIGSQSKMVYTLGLKYDQTNFAWVFINIDANNLINSIANSEQDYFNLIIVGEDNMAIYDNFNETKIHNVYDEFLIISEANERGIKSRIQYERNPVSLISIIHSTVNDWRFLSIVPINKFQDIQNSYKTFIVLLIIICMGLSLVLSLIITIRTVTPVNTIMKMIDGKHKIGGKPIELDNLRREKINELKYIANAIDLTRSEYDQMSEELEKRYKLLKKAKTIALQSQINPHFLFNSLESINWKVMSLTRGNNDASRMIQQLSKLLRFSLNADSNIIPMKDEIEHAMLYLEFQKKRYEDKFTVEFIIDEDVYEYSGVNLMLQPILENAIYHGIRPSENKHHIKIDISLSKENMIIYVIDDGLGISIETVDRINQEMNEEYIRGEHIGLANVNQRLKIIYGEEYGIKIRSIKGEMTEVKIIIPKVKKASL